MDFILYFLLRRFFVHLDMERSGIRLSKGLLLRREHYIPASAVIAAEIRRTPLLRLLKGKHVTLITLSGRISFFLGRDEIFPLIPAERYPAIRPALRSVVLGAFADTRAFSGAVVFSAAISRIGSVLGSDYYDRIIAAIDRTAAELHRLLSAIQIAVPRITAVIAVFIAAAWISAFIRNIMKYMRFSVSADRGCITVRHGVFTLYERMVVPNSLGRVTFRDNSATLFFGASPMYFLDMPILPPLSENDRRRALRALLKKELPRMEITPHKRATVGHIAIPLGWGCADIAALVLCYIEGNAVILRSLLWLGLVLCGWYCGVFYVYMKQTGISPRGGAFSARKGTRLDTVLLLESSGARRISRNPFQRYSGMCDVSFPLRMGGSLRLRGMIYGSVTRL